jgi:heat-inducible transcriptional repressor
MTLDERKASILRAVVEEYIDTALPVGSGHVARAPDVNVSSATVRNEMVALEQEGFLHQPHTSAGRVPTEKGYRFFVDSLGDPRLGATESQQVRSFFSTSHGALERMLSDTTRFLSGLTHSAAVVVGPPHEAATIRSVQLVGLTPNTALLVVVLSNGVVEKEPIEFADEVAETQLAEASAALSSLVIGSTLADASRVVAPKPLADDPVVGAALLLLARAETHDSDQVFIGGASQIASSFDAVATVSEILRLLEEQFVVVSLLQDVLDRGLNVAIGTETGIAPLADCAVVVAPYTVDGEPAGTIGVLGPTRMNYPQALAAVAVVSQRLGRQLSEG